MPSRMDPKTKARKAADVVRDAGGRVVGRTRFQKTAYFLELAGVGDGFAFEYRHYGPFSDELADAIRTAEWLNLVTEEEQPTSWGGFYSILSVNEDSQSENPSPRSTLASLAVNADPIELELAATAVFLYVNGEIESWQETARWKPEKSKNGRLAKALTLYEALRAVDTPSPLPAIH